MKTMFQGQVWPLNLFNLLQLFVFKYFA